MPGSLKLQSNGHPVSLESNLEAILGVDSPTPYLYIDAQQINAAVEDFAHVFSRENVFYAVKANSDPAVVSLLAKLGVGFEVSSLGELDILFGMGVEPGRIISGNPIKSPEFIEAAATKKIGYMAIDSQVEVEKLSEIATGTKVIARLVVSNEGSDWPLTLKYGVEPDEAVQLLLYASDRGLIPHGLSFHVGSQCRREATWRDAIDAASQVWEEAERKGLNLAIMNLGGGFPIPYEKPVPDRPAMLESILRYAQGRFPSHAQFHVEPGRAIIGEAGALVGSVLGQAQRDGKQWLYLDVGVFNGLMETVGGIRYPMVAERDGAPTTFTLAGPSCDSFDVIANDVVLPSPKVGDKVVIFSAGAYTTVYASRFIGYQIPPVIIH